jgi:hypothetical protein
MKKLILIIAIVAGLLIGTMGGVVLAAPPDKPVDTWTYVADKIDEIILKLTDSDSGLIALDTKLTPLYHSDNSTARIASDQGAFTIEDNTDDTFYLSDEYPEGAHFDVTVHIEEEGGGDWVEVWEYYGDGSLYNRDVYNYPGAFYLTSDARQLELKYHSSSAGSVNLTVYWGVTVTYAAYALAELD